LSVTTTTTMLTVTITGTSPLVLDRMASDEEEIIKEIRKITSKGGNMTPEDLSRKDLLQYRSRLYVGVNNELVMPWANISRAMRSGAVLISTRAAGQTSGINTSAVEFPVDHDGPQEASRLYDNPRYVWRTMVNGNPTGKKAMVPTVRPILPVWQITVPVIIFNEVIGVDLAKRVFSLTGQATGIGNARKLGYGRFTCSFKEEG
jgi:hypothetical protein